MKYLESCIKTFTPIPLLTSPLKGEEPGSLFLKEEEPGSLPLKGRVRVGLENVPHVRPLPFKGRAWEGMGSMKASRVSSLPLKGRVGVGMGEFLVCMTKFSYGHFRKCQLPNNKEGQQ